MNKKMDEVLAAFNQEGFIPTISLVENQSEGEEESDLEGSGEEQVEESRKKRSHYNHSHNYTANVNSNITDKLKYLSVISKQTHLFLDIFESCYNHRQMSVKIKIKSHIQQKN